MTFRLIIRPEAEADLAGARHWYEHQCEGLGQEFFDAVDRTLCDIQAMPLLYAAE